MTKFYCAWPTAREDSETNMTDILKATSLFTGYQINILDFLNRLFSTTELTVSSKYNEKIRSITIPFGTFKGFIQIVLNFHHVQ